MLDKPEFYWCFKNTIPSPFLCIKDFRWRISIHFFIGVNSNHLLLLRDSIFLFSVFNGEVILYFVDDGYVVLSTISINKSGQPEKCQQFNFLTTWVFPNSRLIRVVSNLPRVPKNQNSERIYNDCKKIVYIIID